MQPQPEQIQVDPTAVINHQQAMTSQFVGQLIHEIAVTRAALDQSRGEVDRLTRVNETLQATSNRRDSE